MQYGYMSYEDLFNNYQVVKMQNKDSEKNLHAHAYMQVSFSLSPDALDE